MLYIVGRAFRDGVALFVADAMYILQISPFVCVEGAFCVVLIRLLFMLSTDQLEGG